MEKFNFEPETICDFWVNKERKEIWQIELDMVEKIIEICKKHDIKYSLAGGSLLGAIRHHGFIPWDDDIDIMMLRKEYNQFLNIAKKELKEPYFVQYNETEKGYYYGHAQIRNSNTTAIIKSDSNNKNFNHGIFVDIFPLDNIPDEGKEKERFLRNIQRKKKWIIRASNNKKINGTKDIIKKLIVKAYWNNKDLYKEIDKFNEYVQKYNNIETKQVGAIAFRPEEFKYDKEWFSNFENVNFEYLKVKIIKEYDKLLKRQYGDYMEIPENKNGTLHGNVFFDTKNSYKKYNENIDEITSKL